jgi:hypothetical protein
MLRDNDKVTTPYGVQVTTTGDIVTMSTTSTDITSIIRSAHWLGVPIYNTFRVLVFAPDPLSVDITPLVPVVGYIDDKPVIHPLIIGRYRSISTLLWVDIGADFNVVKDKYGYIKVDFGHLVFTDNPNINDDTVQVIGTVSTPNRKVTNIPCQGSVITVQYQPSRMDSATEYGSTHLPYQTGWCNAIRCGQYVYTTAFGPYDINGKPISSNDYIAKAIKNVTLSVKPFNVDNPTRLLVFTSKDIYKDQVMDIIRRLFNQDIPIVECVTSDNVDSIRVAGFYYQPVSSDEES